MMVRRSARSSASTEDGREERPAPVEERARFRADVEGLRAVAVGLVLLYHAGLPAVPAGFVGVDVFFVISGFLITQLLLTELAQTGGISLKRFYARRAKRLLPAAAVVLAATAAMVVAFAPKARWTDIGGDIVASAMYVVNWRLADRSVDYLAEDVEPSPVQHFWSLAVEEQYYLVWPLLLIIVTWFARRRGRSLGPSLWLGLAVAGIPSLAWSVYQTTYEPASAFFITTTRMWELAIGAAIAIGAGRLTRMPRGVAIGLGWAGVAGIGTAAVVFSTDTPWPGYAAAVPTIGAAAVIAAGTAANGKWAPSRVLGTMPFRWVGGLSYSLYLWHWPLIVIAATYWGDLSVNRGLAVAALSFVPAWLTHRLVENPVRYSAAVSRSPSFALSLGANFSLAGVVAGVAVVLAVPQPASDLAVSGPTLGAAVLAAEPEGDPRGAPIDRALAIRPDPLQAPEDVPDLYSKGCQQSVESSEVVSCEYGPDDYAVTIAVVGDSKVAQWLPALEVLAEQNRWRVVTYTKSRCPFATVSITIDGDEYTSCREWTDNVLAVLTDSPPDFVITSQGRKAARPDGATGAVESSADAMANGLRDTWNRLSTLGIQVIVLADTPHSGMNVYECVAENPDQLTRCTYDRAEGVAKSSTPTLQEAVEASRTAQEQIGDSESRGLVAMIDLTSAICPTERCAPVIGDVLVYRQGSHITATYITTLAPRLGEALKSAGVPISVEDKS
jgi:peptidoglycan/LPS O-acetylase OafA/YrhL